MVFRELLFKGKPGNWPTPPTEEELEDYESSEDPEAGPTFDLFRLDFLRFPLRKSIWNMRAAEIFAEQYSRTHPGLETPSEVKQDFFNRYLNEIWGEYRKSLDPSSKSKAEINLKRQRRRNRTGTVSCFVLKE